MPLVSGTKLGPYEVIGPLGAGGMGEVYRARDTRLDRTVAVKILPAHLSSDATLRQRFDQEAKAISSLNHSHICALYDIGQQDGIGFLVMEFLEGETLAQVLEKGPLPLPQVLKIGREICDALDKAHRQGIIHRDLKPANIMLTKSGAKLLDFGLAKAALPLATGATLTAAVPRTTPVTQQGTILGTFQYMSPEQVEASELDSRSDIFSFGSVLYEMVTGRHAFPGKSQFSVASAILEKDPEPMSALQPMTPPVLDHAIRRCLAKDPEDRWQSARDLFLELASIAESGSSSGFAPSAQVSSGLRERLAWVAVAVLGSAAAALGIALLSRAPQPLESTSLSVETGTGSPLDTEFGAAAILSPDGRRMAFVAVDSNQERHIYVRSLDQLQASALRGTENATDPFFSPDGQWLGFFADNKLKKISIQGGTAVSLCDATTGHGGAWSDDGSIFFTPTVRSPIFKIPSAGGNAEPLLPLDQKTGEVTQRWPHVLSGGKAVLFTSNTHGGNYEDANIDVYSLSTGQRKTIFHRGYYARYLPTGHILFMREGTIFASAFDAQRLEVSGQPVPIVEGVTASPGNGGAQFSFSQTGNFVYIPGRRNSQNIGIFWMDNLGKFTPLRQALGDYYDIVFSPDGHRATLEMSDGKRIDIWVYDWARETLERLTFAGQMNANALWTPDGQRVAYTTLDNGDRYDMYLKRSDGAGETLRLTNNEVPKFADSWSPDGRTLIFEQRSPGSTWALMTLTIEGDEKSGFKIGEAKPLLNSPFDLRNAAVSPDGRWLAYRSNEAGNVQVYVQPLSGLVRRWQISTDGGSCPKWSYKTKELFYRTPTFTGGQDLKVMVAPYSISGDSFVAEKPRAWSDGLFSIRGSEYSGFGVHPDGKRVAVLRVPDTGAAPAITKVSLILNFSEELRRKVLSGKN